MIGAGADVGPYAYLRPGTQLGAEGKIGTFVETKNAQIGAGAKVPHLTYVGDAEIGDGANIGAGVIFANYDGVTKSTHARSGDYSFVGSNSVLAAPVTIADGAYVAAGSTITGDVGSGRAGGRPAAGSATSPAGWPASGPAPRRRGRPRRARPAPAGEPTRRSTTGARRSRSSSHARGQPVTGVKKPNDKHLMLFSGRAYPELADEIAALMGVELVPTRALNYANSEIYVRFEESVRGSDAFVHPEPRGAGQRVDDGAVDHGRRAEAGLGQADHRGRPVLPVRPAGQEAPRPGADLGPAGRRPVQDRRAPTG